MSAASDAAEDRVGTLLEHFSRAIAQTEVCAMALRSMDDKPPIGSIAAALEIAVQSLAEAHGEADLHLQQVAP